MKTIAGILGALSVALLLCGCNHVVENTNIPDWRVAFIIDVSISGTDNDLAEGLVANARIYDEEHPAMQSYGVGAYGYSGVVVTRGIDDMLYAFDTCCPYEAKRDISLEIAGYYMTCPKCGSSFQIFDGSGYPVDGQSLTTMPMKRYVVRMLGTDRYLVQNDY